MKQVPIPLTCISCKLLEHILASNMMKQLESNNILFEFQHGFRANRTCESQIIFRIHQLTYNKDKNIQTDLMIMNLAKAFDTVLHKRILRIYIQTQILWHVTTGNKLDYIILIQQNSNSNTRKYYIRKITSNIRCSSGHCTRTYILSNLYKRPASIH